MTLTGWNRLVAKQCRPAANLFPRKIADRVLGYLERTEPCSPEQWAQIETVIHYAQLRAAQDECRKNGKIYEEYYGPYLEHFASAIERQRGEDPLLRRAGRLLPGHDAHRHRASAGTRASRTTSR